MKAGDRVRFRDDEDVPRYLHRLKAVVKDTADNINKATKHIISAETYEASYGRLISVVVDNTSVSFLTNVDWLIPEKIESLPLPG